MTCSFDGVKECKMVILKFLQFQLWFEISWDEVLNHKEFIGIPFNDHLWIDDLLFWRSERVQNGDRKVASSCSFNCGWKFPEMSCSTIRNLLASPSMKSKLYKFCVVVQISSQSIVLLYVKIMSTSRNRYTHFFGGVYLPCILQF
jgi:hypothetical protein